MEETTLLKLDKVEICREENVILHEASFTLHNGESVSYTHLTLPTIA